MFKKLISRRNYLVVLGVFAAMLMHATATTALDRYVTQFGIIQLEQNAIRDSNSTQRLSIGSTNAFTGNLTVSGNTTLTGTNTFSSTTTYSSNVNIAGRVLLGTSGTTVSTTTVYAGAGYVAIPMYLAGTVDAVQGAALFASGNNGSRIEATVSLNLLSTTTIIGVAEAATSTGSVVNCIISGFALALTTGPVNIGDILTSSNTSRGALGASTTTVYGADFGVALTTGTAAGGLTLIKIRK